MKSQDFLDNKLGIVISALLKIRADKSYDSQAEKIKKMSFNAFMKLADEVNTKASDAVIAQSDAEYEVVPIYSYEELHKSYGGKKTGYNGMSEWCHTNGKSTYDSWTERGTKMFFVIQRKDWRRVKAPHQIPGNAYDEYGMSLIAVLVDVSTNKLLRSTSRWNHVVLPNAGDADQMFKTWQELDLAVGIDVESICRDKCASVNKDIEAKSELANYQIASMLAGKTAIDRDMLVAFSLATDVVIPDVVTRIGDFAFSGFTKLKSIVIPDSVRSIGEYAFSNCCNLENIAIPDSVTRIRSHAFTQCHRLKSIKMPSNAESIEQSAFALCLGLEHMTVPDKVTSIGIAAFANCQHLMSIAIGARVTDIGQSAFCNCVSIADIVIPDSVVAIEYLAFQHCRNLKTVTIGKSVASIGSAAFAYCSNLKQVVFKGKTLEQVKAMGNYPWEIKDTSIIAVEP